MKIVNIHEVKARLSEYLELVERGERVLICRRNQPVAELRAVASARVEPRPLGGSDIVVPPAFFDPLPDAIEGAFYDDQVPAVFTAAESREASRPSPRQPRRPRR